MKSDLVICPDCRNENDMEETFIYEHQGNSIFRCKNCDHTFAEFEAEFKERGG